MTARLEERLSELARELDPAEREDLKLILSMAAGGLLGGHTRGANSPRQDMALHVAQRALPLLHKPIQVDIAGGVVFRGRAPFFTDRDIEALDQESRRERAKAGRFHDHLVVNNAPLAAGMALSSEIRDYLESKVGPVFATNKANYLYYDAPGLGIDPHVDVDEFSLNVLTMLEHSGVRQSCLMLYPPDAPEQEVRLEPGETLIFLADRVTHERIRTGPDERIRIVSFGYKLI
ncbi:MAG: hypothetical protein V9G08_00080 [Dermatophilaceae bacterium]